MDVNEVILNFIAFLNAGYTAWLRSARALLLEHDRLLLDEAFCDWAQANWELLVERTVCQRDEYLQIYSSGSDYEAQSYSRVFFHEALPTHEISCSPASGRVVIDVLSGREFDPTTCRFDRFVGRKADWYADEPPFDHVLLEIGKMQHLALVSTVKFSMRPIDKDHEGHGPI